MTLNKCTSRLNNHCLSWPQPDPRHQKLSCIVSYTCQYVVWLMASRLLVLDYYELPSVNNKWLTAHEKFLQTEWPREMQFSGNEYRNEPRLFFQPPSEATVPRNFHSLVLSPTEVKLSWGPAPNENSRISGYTIYQVSNEWTSRLVVVFKPMRTATVQVSDSCLVSSEAMNTNHEPIIGSWLVCPSSYEYTQV